MKNQVFAPRLANKVALIFGGGQIEGETIGNGRATALTFARHGAKVMVADINLLAGEETCRGIREEGGEASAVRADVTCEADCKAAIEACIEKYGQIDILFNNVGISPGDGPLDSIERSAWDRIMAANVTGMFLACKHALPYMRQRGTGSIINMSSMMSVASDATMTSASEAPDASGSVAYKVSKAAVNSLTHSLAMANAPYGVRINAILPGLMDTPNAIEPISKGRGISREALRAERDALVPLRGKMGTAWDVANAALFLASDEAHFITNVLLPVDGGQSGRIG